MKQALFLIAAAALLGMAPSAEAGLSLSIAPQTEWELTSSSVAFSIDVLIGPGEAGEFHIRIKDGDPGLFTGATLESAAGDMAEALAYTQPGVTHSAYQLIVADSQGNLPGGVAARLNFFQEWYGNTLIEAFNAQNGDTPTASIQIVIFDFFFDDDFPVPGDESDPPVPEPATILLLGLGGLAVRMRKA